MNNSIGNINYGLVGQFKYDLYRSGELVESSDFFPNFITQTGLMYPFVYSFADCFRFLSLGSSPASNVGSQSLASNGTTGLTSPLTNFTCADGTSQNCQYMGIPGYATGGAFCGTVVSTNGPRFYRAWNIPSGINSGNGQPQTVNSPSSGIQINEFMVSPSSGTDPVGAYAFSRVLKSLFIPNGYNAIITYQLQLLIQNTGYTIFPPGTFITGNADVSEDFNIIQGWSNLSGYYKQIYFGLRCVDQNGLTYIPIYGDGMEPATQYLNSLNWYLSPDNSQFDVNNVGGLQTNVKNAYGNDGLRAVATPNLNGIISTQGVPYNTTPPISNLPTTDTLSAPPSMFVNLRLGDSSNTTFDPQLNNYSINQFNINYQQNENYANQPISIATPGGTGYSNSQVNYGQQAIVSSFTSQLPINYSTNSGQNLITGRHKTITRKSVFSPASSLGWNTRFGSMVYAFNYTNAIGGSPPNNYYPYIDTLFFDTSGRTTMSHYRFITGIYLTNRGSGILNCQLGLTVGNNVNQFVLLPTFQGGYQGSPSNFKNPLTNFCDTNSIPSYLLYWGGTQCCSGLVLDGIGLQNTDSYGITGVTGDGWGNSGSGVGAIYGIQTNDYFCTLNPDLGIMDHSIYQQNAYTTGNLTWPMVTPFGTPVNLIVTGLQYWDTGFAFGWPALSDNSNFFNGTKQIVKRIDFVPVSSGNTSQSLNINGWNSNVLYQNANGIDIGYYLTTQQFTGTSIPASAFQITSPAITGYLISNNNAQGNLVFGDLYRGGSLPSSPAIITGFSVLTTTSNPNSYISGLSNLNRVTGLFASFSERGYLNNNPLTTLGSYNVFFTGFNGASTTPVYITNVFSLNSSNGPFTGYSIMSGMVRLTNHCPPTGYPEHTESVNATNQYNLLPNYAIANYYGNTSNYPVSVGGALPATSLDNSLEVYLNINWSACCGGALNCIGPDGNGC